ncbi:1-acylglycerol-3-phosphate O-acyltransferase SLC1 [Rhodotorula paludigena]|uniref:1-acylglycerol-3-phosphate O-acyltransferase SLC1 n=1 Tax=Rhodotorula paludigena TaxID=86838 RepID=UPI0031780AB3
MPGWLGEWLIPVAFWSAALGAPLMLALARLAPAAASSPSSSPVLAASYALASVLPAVMLSRVFAPVRYYVRLTTFLLGAAGASAVGVLSSLFMTLAGRRSDIQWLVARTFRYSVAPALGITFRTEGEEHLRDNCPAVLVGNHQTMLDLLYLGAIFPKSATIMAKRQLQYVPFLGAFMTLSRAIFIDRAKRSDAIAIFAKVAAEMKRKSLSLFIFPEGTRSASAVPNMLPLKKGAFHLAVQAGLPIVPIVCENYAHVYHAKARRFNDGEIVVRVLPPISVEGFTSSSEDIARLAEQTRAAMLAAIEQLGRERQAKLAAAAGGERGERQALLAGQAQGASEGDGEGEGETASARLDEALEQDEARS